MSWTLPAASVLDEVLDLVGILLSATAVGSGLAITIGVLGEKPLSEIEELGFLGTAGGFLVGALIVTTLLVIRT